MAIIYTNTVPSKTFQNIPKLVCLVLKIQSGNPAVDARSRVMAESTAANISFQKSELSFLKL
jgi:hypothetical protein